MSARTKLYSVTLAISFAAHVLLLTSMGRAAHRAPPTSRRQLVQLTIVHPMQPPAEPPKPPPPPPPSPRPRVHKQAVIAAAQPTPTETPPVPTPNETPTKEQPTSPVVPVFGISLSSTASESSFAVPVGSTLMAEPKAGPRVTPHPYSVPDYQLSERPKRLGECIATYPDEAKKQGIEGRVTLDVEIHDDGTVGAVTVTQGIGHGLDEAAVEALKRCRFRPARLGNFDVPTHIQYIYNFIIET